MNKGNGVKKLENENIDLGVQIRTLRTKRKKTIAELSEETSLSTGMISKIERNLVVPSVISLWKIAGALNVSIGSFFDQETHKQKTVVRRNERRKIITQNSNAFYELLSPDLNRKIEFLMITIEPGEATSLDEKLSHDGEECGVVIKGKVLVQLDNEEHILEEGDSIYFDSSRKHRYLNVGEDVCVSVWAMTPPTF